jgi:adenylosuccinate synthase
MINGVTRLFMMKADVLSGFGEIKICTSYTINGTQVSELPYCLADIERLNYQTMAGWNCEISKFQKWDELPAELRSYIQYIEKETGVPITIVSVGPDRWATIYR